MSSSVSTAIGEHAGTGPEQQKRDHRQEVTDSIIALLEEGVAP